MSHEANEDASFVALVYQKRQKKSTKEKWHHLGREK
jgi:hypothetical protein